MENQELRKQLTESTIEIIKAKDSTAKNFRFGQYNSTIYGVWYDTSKNFPSPTNFEPCILNDKGVFLCNIEIDF